MRKDTWFTDEGKLVFHKKTDPNPVLNSAKLLRGHDTSMPMSDSVHVARLDAHVVEKWVKEAGLKWSDREAVRDLIKRKMMDSDNAAFRVWNGTF